MVRILDIVFFIYFLTHIPITIFVDLQSLLPTYLYPQTLIDLKNWYCVTFRDPMMALPPPWFQSLITCELILQSPFFPFACYGYYKGAENCQWLRFPALIYGTHVATTILPVYFHILFQDFTHESTPAPRSLQERLCLMSIYTPYFVLPVLMMLDALFSPAYTRKQKSASGGKKVKSPSKKVS